MVVVPEGHAAAGSRRRRRLDDKSGRRVHSEPASAKGVGARRRSGQAKADSPRDLRKTTVCPTVETSAVGELCWNVHETRPTLFLACSPGDRKSTRLNSSHSSISYAVFCLKKKKQ